MEKEQEALKKFMGDLGGNTDEAALNLGVEGEAEGEAKADLEDKPLEEGTEEKLPFHKDPKVQRYIDRQLEKRLKDFQPSSREEQFSKEVTEDPLIEAFTAVIGNDTPEKVNALKALKRSIQGVKDEAAESAYGRFVEESKQAKEADRQAEEELYDGLERVEESYNIDLSSNSPSARKTRNEFLDFLEKISPKNEDGEVVEYADFEQAFDTFKSMRKPQNTQAKQIASRGMERSSADATNTPTKRITFDNVREMMGLEN